MQSIFVFTADYFISQRISENFNIVRNCRAVNRHNFTAVIGNVKSILVVTFKYCYCSSRRIYFDNFFIIIIVVIITTARIGICVCKKVGENFAQSRRKSDRTISNF